MAFSMTNFHYFLKIQILWFLYNCFFLVTMYRVECPYKGANAKPYSWTSLRPSEDQLNVTKSKISTFPTCSFYEKQEFEHVGDLLFIFVIRSCGMRSKSRVASRRVVELICYPFLHFEPISPIHATVPLAIPTNEDIQTKNVILCQIYQNTWLLPIAYR